MTQVIVYADAETGRIRLCVPTGDVPLDDVLLHDCPSGGVLLDAADLPVEDAFLDACVLEGLTVRVEMSLARDIHRQRMRTARAEKLAALDVAWQRAEESGDDAAKAHVGACKQALRDVTKEPALDAATDLVALRRVWPAILGTAG